MHGAQNSIISQNMLPVSGVSGAFGHGLEGVLASEVKAMEVG